MICPDCKGAKQVGALVDFADRRLSGPRMVDCPTCRGTGEITDEHAARIEEGRKRRDDRVTRRVSLREEARALGMPPEQLAAIENGRVPK